MLNPEVSTSKIPEHIQQELSNIENILDNANKKLDEALCSAGLTRRDMGLEQPRCPECVCQD